MKKKLLIGLGALVASAAVLASALPAQAYTPTVSGILYPPGVDPGDTWVGGAVTSDAKTYVVTDSNNPVGLWVIDVASNTATAVTATPRAGQVIIDKAGAFAYAYGNHTSRNIYKIDLSTKTVVATWTDPALTLNSSLQMILSGDESSLYLVGYAGNYPAVAPAVAKVNLASGTIAQFTSGATGNYVPGGAAYDTVSGHIFIPYKDSATGLVSGFQDFNTTANTFSGVVWTGSGVLNACDLKSAVWVCLVDDTNPYITKIDSTGTATGTPLAVDAAVDDIDSVTLTPDGSQAYVFASGSVPGAGSKASAQVVDTAAMSSVTVLNFVFDYSNQVLLAPDAGQIWFTADYFQDYDGGYQIVQFAEPKAQLADTGLDPTATAVTAVSLGAAGVLLLGLYRARRRAATSAK